GKDRGKRGKVLDANPKTGRVTVENISVIKRHTKANPNLRQAGIVERPAPINASNVMVICDKCSKPTRVGYQVVHVQEMGATRRDRTRVCKQCHQQIA
ncbi:MAG: 50S ribosomal protein L24, partial [Chloroflexi bacterium]|nr:50S ribosomal protein L24 [Chloroflexota bacterium]